MEGQVVFSGTGADGGKYEIIQSGDGFMIHANGNHIDTYGSLQRAMSVLQNEVPGLTKGVAEGLPQTLRKVVPGYAKREIDKKMDAEKFGRTDVDRDANFQRYKKIQDKLKEQGVAEASLGDYRKKAALSKATSQIDRFFGRDDPAQVAQADQTIAKRERGLARADARVRPYTPPVHDAEKYQRDLTAKYPNIDELVADAERNRDPYYDRAEGSAYYRGREAEQNYQRLKQIQRVIQGLNESLNRSHLP
jgi:hypothetical protein